MSYRNDDDDECGPLPKKTSRNYHQHIRRRIPKRYSDIVGPSTTKIFLQRKDSFLREKQTFYLVSQANRSSTNVPRRHSLKPINETFYYFNTNRRKSRDLKDDHPHYPAKHTDLLAQRMQAAMSSELMHSLDRNFVFGDRKQTVNHVHMSRSHSFNICTSWNDKSKRNSFPNLIPRVKIIDADQENILREEPTPDYDEHNEEIVIRTVETKNEMEEEPVVDYDESKSNLECDTDDKSLTRSDRGISSSFIIPQTSTSTTDEQTSTPPIAPPLPNLNNHPKTITFRCRTIADQLSSDHKLILKDEQKIKSTDLRATSQQAPSKPHYFHISKDNKLRRLSSSLAHLYSSNSSLTKVNDRDTDVTSLSAKPAVTDKQIQECLSSSPATSAALENDYEQRSSSSKIYNDYKKRASLSSIPTNTTVSHSIIIHPMHTRIGLRSSTSSSSTNEKLTDMTLSSKQMNVCVINQLNEHLSTRFRKQHQQESCSNNTNQQSYDPPPLERMSENNQIQSNVYDEPKDIPIINALCSSSIPPPPPPLPVGGFRPIKPAVNRSSNSQRTSIMTLPREVIHSNVPRSTGTSTISSNLSNTRILSELRENPLFTRAKQHLEIEPGSNGRRSGRRLIGSTSNLTNTETTTTKETKSYLRLDNCSKTDWKKPIVSTNVKQMETITMLPYELDAVIGKRTKSTNDINQIKSRPCKKSFTQTPCRKSELELIFQKRAQRNEQNWI